jgi:hypothetical protein
MAATLLRKPQTAKEAANQLGRIKQFFLEKGFSVSLGVNHHTFKENCMKTKIEEQD